MSRKSGGGVACGVVLCAVLVCCAVLCGLWCGVMCGTVWCVQRKGGLLQPELCLTFIFNVFLILIIFYFANMGGTGGGEKKPA